MIPSPGAVNATAHRNRARWQTGVVPILYRNGRVHSPAAPRATALLVDGEKVTWVGGEDGAEHPVGVQVVDLRGAFLAPAFVDAHVHATATGLGITGLDLRSTSTLGEALDAIERMARTNRGRPILGGGWDESRWPERRPPTAAGLGRAADGGAGDPGPGEVPSAGGSSAGEGAGARAPPPPPV